MFCADWRRSLRLALIGKGADLDDPAGRGLDTVEIAAVWITAGALVAMGVGRAGATTAAGATAATGAMAGLVAGADAAEAV